MSATLTRCEHCPHGNTRLVGSRGPIDSPFVIVGEGPGSQEVIKGLPFVGPSGKVLEHGLAQNPDCPEPFITNATICFPGHVKKKDKDKIGQATQCCQKRLLAEVSAYPRKVILALGNAALWGLTGNFGSRITQVRGQIFPSPLAEHGIVASVHPSYLLRGGGSYRQYLADVDYAQGFLQGKDLRKFVIPKLHVVTSEQEINILAREFRGLPPGTPIAGDSETGGWDGFDHLRDRILCAGFCFDSGLVYVIPEDLIPSTQVLFDNECDFIWHNGKFDAKFFRAPRASVRNVRVTHDTMLLSYALDETKGIHNLEQVCSDILGMPDWKFMIQKYLDGAKANKQWSPKPQKMGPDGKLKPGTVTYECIPKPVLYDYMSRDISGCLQVFPTLRRHVLQDRHLEKLYTRLLMPASDYLIEVEENGMMLDPEQVDKNSERLLEQIAIHTAEFNRILVSAGGQPVNLNSPMQLAGALYDVFKFPGKGRSTDIKALNNLPDHPAVTALKRNRKVQKAESTYVRPARSWIGADGRVHTTYKINGTATGRLASEDPNLLNIPRDPLLRGQFVAAPGCIFLEVDVNQAELRVLAELSGDPELTRIYTTKGLSIHDEMTKEIFGDINEYTNDQFQLMVNKFNVHNFPEKLYDEQKMRAKNVNFGIPYGITPFGLAEQIDVSAREAGTYLDKWNRRFAGAALFIRKCREAPLKGQTIVTFFGRKKRFGAVSREKINDLQNEASNFPMQSIASDIVLDTGIYMRPIANKLGARIVNTVYDSILYELPLNRPLIEDIAHQTQEKMRQTAIDWGMKRIPIQGDAKLGVRWGSLTEIGKFWKQHEAEAA